MHLQSSHSEQQPPRVPDPRESAGASTGSPGKPAQGVPDPRESCSSCIALVFPCSECSLLHRGESHMWSKPSASDADWLKSERRRKSAHMVAKLCYPDPEHTNPPTSPVPWRRTRSRRSSRAC